MANDSVSQELIETLVANGRALLVSLDYVQELKILQVPIYNLTRKSLIKREFKALYLALWHLALEQPFQTHYQATYDQFLKQDWIWETKNQREILERSEMYYEKLQERGKDDFTEIAKHILSLAVFDDESIKKNVLKLALLIRSRYVFLFENLA